MNPKEIEKLILDLNTENHQMRKQFVETENLIRLKAVLKLYEGEGKVISFSEVVDKIKKQPDELKILSGWKGLDDILGGFRPQQLVVVSALTKSGKTSWLMDLTSRISEHGPLWFPFEESAEELLRKYIEKEIEPPHGFTPETMCDGTIDWIERRIAEGIAKYNSRCIFIDQLDFLIPYSSDNRADRIGDVMRKLKGLAKKWNIVIFLICHLSKARMDTEPTLEDLKGSSAIGQEADTVIILWREMKREKGKVVITNNTNISIQANRRTGKTGNVKMIFQDGRFLEKDWEQNEQEIMANDAFDNF